MKRVLLILEDYNELLFIETVLKKLGFDVEGTQKTKGLSDTFMTFRPGIMIVSESIKEGRVLELIHEYKQKRPELQAMVFLNVNSKLPTHQGADAFISRPINPVQIVKILAEWSGVPEGKILDKMEKLNLYGKSSGQSTTKSIKGGSSSSESFTVSGRQEIPGLNPQKFKQSEEQKQNRSQRLHNALKEIPIPKSEKLDHKTVLNEIREFRQREKDPEILSIDKERRDFVDALYVKGRKG